MTDGSTLAIPCCPTCGRIIPRPLSIRTDGTVRCPRRRCRDTVPAEEVVAE